MGDAQKGERDAIVHLRHDSIAECNPNEGTYPGAVKGDLALAEDCLAPHGVITLDDFHRPECADVSTGYFEWYSARQRAIVPFAIGFNKLYLCEANWVERYGCVIANDTFLKA